ncbi:GxGYxY sequence motif-containing protein [Pseudoxanthomonas sp. GM95]|uniref:GxGYxYP domain-containing protein n=1 Tax=Pseudoxanthomonas sp. GM95 TaxID=1881043 RepID=UPI0008AADA18|nr:GxGYxYP domain-containing protein [Pseudoxanthomonas sp. GM95]SEK87527.1 GxGYxY sequence motif-containing protein [Pseudoxanthomonas sp. GM95]
MLPSFASPTHLDAASVAALPGEDQLLLTTLQGVVNRRKPSLYFLYDQGEDTPDERWLAGFPSSQVTLHADALSLVARYRDRARGAIVYDPDVPDSVNVATTLAGLESAVVATAEQAALHGFRVIEDLRGRFTGQDKVQIYQWQRDHLWPRCEHRLLAGLAPTRLVDVPDVAWREVARETQEIRDSSNRAVLTLDLSAELGGEAIYVRFTDSFTSDGWGASVGAVTAVADGVTIAEFIPGTEGEAAFLFSGNAPIGGEQNRFADGGNYFVYRFAPPAGTTTFTVTVDIWNQYLITATDTAPQRHEPIAYFRDYVVATQAMVVWLDPNGAPGELLADIFDSTATATPYLGWFSNDVAGEWGGVDLAAAHGVEVFAADYFMNATVHGGVRAQISGRPRRPKPEQRANKIYLTLTFGEGDNLQFCQRHLRELWDNPARGQVPTNWTISPVLIDAGPGIYRYFQKTATGNDLLICGPSGAGYTYGGSWPGDTFAKYADITDRYLRQTGLDLVYAYNNRNADDSGWLPIDGTLLQTYRRRTGLRGIIQSWETGGILATGQLPVIGNFSQPGSAAEYKQALDAHVGDWDGLSPFFIAAGINAWNWTPQDIVELAARLAEDDRYRIVLADTFFNLLRDAPNAQPHSA